MLSFPNAKVNLGLRILSKRDDGYHTIESCLYPIPWHDVLEIVPSGEKTSFTQTGLTIDGNSDDNLVLKAYRLLKEKFDIPEVQIHLHKVIPMGAGLGGGSSDAAFALRLLNQIFELALSANELKEFASSLGSDCPFFIDNLPAMATGTGTQLDIIDLDLSEYYILVVHPGVHISTREAYSGVVPNDPGNSLTDLLHYPTEAWNDVILNDFEKSIFKNHTEIADLKGQMNELGAVYTAMSGSGSAVFGIFQQPISTKQFGNYSVLLSRLKV